MKLNMNKPLVRAVFIGFDYDYEILSVLELTRKEKTKRISHFYFPKIVKFLYYRFSLFSRFIMYLSFRYIQNKIKHCDETVLVIVKDDEFYLNLIERLPYKKIVIFRNVVSGNVLELCKDIKKFTFDIDDSLKYQMEYYSQFTPAYEFLRTTSFNSNYDATFIGTDKGRKVILDDLVSKNKSLKFNVKVVKRNNTLVRFVNSLFLRGQNSYKSFIQEQYSTKCVIDIIQENQSGETMRFIEALIARKKVITNSKNIKAHPLYSKRNVYILGCDERSLSVFINEDFEVINVSKLYSYSSTKILNEIIEKSI